MAGDAPPPQQHGPAHLGGIKRPVADTNDGHLWQLLRVAGLQQSMQGLPLHKPTAVHINMHA